MINLPATLAFDVVVVLGTLALFALAWRGGRGS